MEVEAAVAEFDCQRYLLVPQPLALQQPEVFPVPQHVPLNFAVPPPMPPVDWAEIARALFSRRRGKVSRVLHILTNVAYLTIITILLLNKN